MHGTVGLESMPGSADETSSDKIVEDGPILADQSEVRSGEI